MLWKLFQLREEEGSFSRSRLVHLFVSEGLWYFILVSIANLVNGIMYVQPVKTLSGLMVPFSNMLPNVLACRLVLDLREHGSQVDSAWITDGNPVAILDFFKFRFPTPPEPTPPLSTMVFKQPTRPTDSGGTNSTSSGAGMLVVSRAVGLDHESSMSSKVYGADRQKKEATAAAAGDKDLEAGDGDHGGEDSHGGDDGRRSRAAESGG
ncbi:hypothetical protein FRB94_003337 [Tulasnella sp. JGI-2019a]|nr:hypothetical protein FRB93_013359 [Tulasnella sp. JGI-2019a]KAG9003176.1 hypothetical protein FRB94_003337 [Tulasnella sp. JGI-2019a]